MCTRKGTGGSNPSLSANFKFVPSWDSVSQVVPFHHEAR